MRALGLENFFSDLIGDAQAPTFSPRFHGRPPKSTVNRPGWDIPLVKYESESRRCSRFLSSWLTRGMKTSPSFEKMIAATTARGLLQ